MAVPTLAQRSGGPEMLRRGVPPLAVRGRTLQKSVPPPMTSTLPSARRVAEWPLRPSAREAVGQATSWQAADAGSGLDATVAADPTVPRVGAARMSGRARRRTDRGDDQDRRMVPGMDACQLLAKRGTEYLGGQGIPRRDAIVAASLARMLGPGSGHGQRLGPGDGARRRAAAKATATGPPATLPHVPSTTHA